MKLFRFQILSHLFQVQVKGRQKEGMYVLYVSAISYLFLILSISVVFNFLLCLGCKGELNIGNPDGPDWRTLILFDGAAAAGERGRGR